MEQRAARRPMEATWPITTSNCQQRHEGVANERPAAEPVVCNVGDCHDHSVDAGDSWIVLSRQQRPIDPAAVTGLFGAESWWPERTAAATADVLGRGPAVGAWTGTRLIGFARAVTDGRYRAYVEDVVVAPARRSEGIAHALVGRLLGELPATALVSLFCSPRLRSLYADLGFNATQQIVVHRTLPRT
jgi:GNAT superfamily N-acetyltransferase